MPILEQIFKGRGSDRGVRCENERSHTRCHIRGSECSASRSSARDPEQDAESHVSFKCEHNERPAVLTGDVAFPVSRDMVTPACHPDPQQVLHFSAPSETHLLSTHCVLGPGCVWTSSTQRLPCLAVSLTAGGDQTEISSTTNVLNCSFNQL